MAGYCVGDEVVVRLCGTCVEGKLGIVAATKATKEGVDYVIDLFGTEPPFDLHTLVLPAEELDHAAW